MSLQFNKFPFYKVETLNPPSGSSSPKGDSKEDMIDFLKDDDEKEVIELDKKEKKDEEKGREKEREADSEKEEVIEKGEEEEEEEVDELKQIEEEIEEPTEEQLELVTPVRRREILAKYPNLFKDFPYLEKAYYREQQFTEIVPTIEDAKIAVEKAQTLDKFETDIMSGNTQTILASVKENDPRAFARIVDNYLPTLAKVDEQAYYHVLGNITKHTIIAMVQEAQRSNNEQLKSAAQLLNQFVFGSSDFKPPSNLSREEKPEDKSKEEKITEREQEFTRRQFESARGDLNTRVNNLLKSTVEAHIDPKQSMTDYVRKNATRDALDTVESLINQDSRFKVLVDKLWEKAFQDGFDKNSVDRIRSAYVSKAKSLLPSVIKKARIEALRGMGKRVVEDKEEESTSINKGPVNVGRPRSQSSNSGKSVNSKEIPKNMRTLDFLMQD